MKVIIVDTPLITVLSKDLQDVEVPHNEQGYFQSYAGFCRGRGEGYADSGYEKGEGQEDASPFYRGGKI